MGSQAGTARDDWRRVLLDGGADGSFAPRAAGAWTQYWDGSREAPPSVDELDTTLEPAVVCLLAASAVRAAWPSFGAVDVTAWLAVLDAFAGDDPESRARARIARGWASLVGGAYGDARDAFEAGRVEARERSIVDAYLEASAGSVLAALELGATDEAIERARRTARSARAEALPPLELLCYLTLARARRESGAPQLAAHVLRAIDPLAPRAWRRAIRWEQELAGAPRDGEPGAIGALLAAVDGGASADRAGADARRESARVAFLAADVRALVAALGGASDPSPAVRAWVEGSSAVVPRGLHAIGRGEHDDLAYVAVGDHAPRRVLSRACRGVGAPSLEPARKPQLRTHALLAKLAWAAPGALAEEALFGELYGFAYDHVRHKQILDTLVHRARLKAAPVATLERGAGHLRLVFTGPANVWDPACQWSAEDRVVAYLASAGPRTARELAASLSLPLRTVQALLRDLTDADGCEARRDGRHVVYVVEDTCFSELTRERFLALLSARGGDAPVDPG